MKHNHLNIPLSIQYDNQLITELKILGLIESKADLGRLCGKNESYVRCMHSKGYGIHIGSLAVLKFKLLLRHRTESKDYTLQKLDLAMNAIQRTINEKCMAQRYENNGAILKAQRNLRNKLNTESNIISRSDYEQ